MGRHYIWDSTESVATRPLYWQPRMADGDYSLFYAHDGNKNVSEVVFCQRARGIAAHYEYVPFGDVLEQTCGNAWGELDLSSLNPWRFSCEYAEDDTATVYYNYRYYNPMYGRWVSKDRVIHNLNSYVLICNAVLILHLRAVDM